MAFFFQIVPFTCINATSKPCDTQPVNKANADETTRKGRAMDGQRITTKEQAEGLPLLLNGKEVAKLLSISERQAVRLAKEGSLPAVQIGLQWRFNRDKVLAFAGIE